MFEPFSSGYYLGRLYVQPRDSGTPAISQADHERVNEQLYATGEGIERLDTPLVMKLGTRHLPVVGDEDVPSGTLTVPHRIVPEELKFELPGRKEVLLAEADRAQELLEYSGWPTSGERG